MSRIPIHDHTNIHQGGRIRPTSVGGITPDPPGVPSGGGGGGSDDQTAAEVPFTPAAGIAATDVQAAIVEVATESVQEADASWIDLTDGGPTTLHSHAGGGLGPLLLASDHSTPIVFDDILQESDFSDFVYASAP